MDLVVAYRSIHDRLIDLAGDLTATQVSATVIPTPAWSVKDTYAHLTGAVEDILTDNLGAFGTEAWTAAHVDRRARDSLETVCEEWTSRLADFADVLTSTGSQYMGLIAGSWTHEQDIRGSVGLRGVGDTGGMHATLEQVAEIGKRIDGADLPGLRIATDGPTWVLGSGGVGATLKTTPYDMARLVYGRRSAPQVRAMQWEGDPEPYLPHIGNYGLAEHDITD